MNNYIKTLGDSGETPTSVSALICPIFALEQGPQVFGELPEEAKTFFKHILNSLILKILFVAFKINVPVATISFLCLSLNECKHTHTHTHKGLRGEGKNIWMLTSATSIWLLLTRGVPTVETPPHLDQVTVNFPAVSERVKRRGSAKSDWWPGSVCLLLLFIHVFILAVVISSDPGPLHPLLSFLPPASEETVSHYIRCDANSTHPRVCGCVDTCVCV